MGKKKEINKIVLISILALFLSFILYLAFSIRMGISPDSLYHLEVSREYSTTLGIPENTPNTYEWRDITRIPYLFFWLNGRLLNLNSGFIDEVILLRMVNVLFSLGTVYVTYLLSKEILKGKWERLLPVFLLANTLMFVFLSSSINYDNLANLLSVLSIFYFVKFVKSKLDIKYLLWMVLFLCIGGLTKFTILPLAFILVVLCLIEIFKKRELIKEVKVNKYFLLILPILVLLFLNFQVYGVNILTYGSLEPDCEQILTHEQCLQNGVYYRDKITFPSIEVGGFQNIFEMIKNGDRIDPISYFPKWIWNITGKVFGIMADSSLEISDIAKSIYLFFLAIGLLIGITNFKKWNKVDRYLIVIVLFYLGVLFFLQNYNMYLKHNHFYLALQGRYIFPVITAMYILFIKSVFFVRNNVVRILLLISLILLFLFGCIPTFFLNVESWWFK